MDPLKHLDETMRGYQGSMILLAAASIGLFDALGERTRSPAELARELDCHERSLETLILALVADGFLVADGQGYALADSYAPYLRSTSPDTLASMLRHNHHLALRWVQLADVVRSGRPVRQPGAGRPPDELRDFIRAMENISRSSSLDVARKLDLSQFRRMLDLGGGPGTAALTFARMVPQLRCVVFDLPEVVGIAQREIARAGLSDRVTTRAGDYLKDDLGEDYDLVYLSNVIHSLGPDDVERLLGKAYGALAVSGSVIVKDFFLEESRTRPAAAARFSVNMLVGTEAGRSYTFAETRRLLAQAGFSDLQQQDVATASAVIIGRKG
jgi:SAM-dependent methyltransferase